MHKAVPIIISSVLVGGIGFFGGMQYGQSTKNTTTPNASQRSTFRQNGQLGTGTNGNSGTMGEIVSNDNTSLTLKLANGGSKIVFFSNTTKITKTVDGETKDLITGKNVSVIGTTNSDGSITAKTIQLRPAITQEQLQNTTVVPGNPTSSTTKSQNNEMQGGPSGDFGGGPAGGAPAGGPPM